MPEVPVARPADGHDSGQREGDSLRPVLLGLAAGNNASDFISGLLVK